jgi:hypothetical protein
MSLPPFHDAVGKQLGGVPTTQEEARGAAEARGQRLARVGCAFALAS